MEGNCPKFFSLYTCTPHTYYICDVSFIHTSAADIKPFWSLSKTLNASLSSSSESVSCIKMLMSLFKNCVHRERERERERKELILICKKQCCMQKSKFDVFHTKGKKLSEAENKICDLYYQRQDWLINLMYKANVDVLQAGLTYSI